jgi:hypothetical protein
MTFSYSILVEGTDGRDLHANGSRRQQPLPVIAREPVIPSSNLAATGAYS